MPTAVNRVDAIAPCQTGSIDRNFANIAWYGRAMLEVVIGGKNRAR